MKQSTQTYQSVERNVALCYIRQSFTRDGEDIDSPERQQANIDAKCKQMGWKTEWYKDADGHKSGRYEKNRPGWLALKERLNDPDVVAVVANDLSRLHRKGWRVGDLIEFLDRRGVSLVLAAPGREIDLSTPMGRLFVQFTAILDEWYASDISQRAKDSISHRKARGKSVGRPPFGTERDDDGYLQPSTDGAWLLSDGTFQTGEVDKPPTKEAIWHSYFEAAKYILEMYATDEYGLEKIAYTMNENGWPFRDRKGQPRPMNSDDIRRVVANWPEYGGMVPDKKAKDRPGYEKYHVDELPFVKERAVFPITLLKEVAQVRQRRSIKPVDRGVKRASKFYPLSIITYCAHCERMAAHHNNHELRTTLTGRQDANGTRRYRHRRGVNCGCTNVSVVCEVIEEGFGRLVKLLTISDKAKHLIHELALQTQPGINSGKSLEELQKERDEATALCKRRIRAAVTLYGDGMIELDEYRRRVDANEREITFWKNRTGETEKRAMQLAMCMEAIDKLNRLWDLGTNEDKQGFARSLFEYITYDLDTQRIVDFRLKKWADEFVIVRGKLYNEQIASEDRKNPQPSYQGLGNDVPHTGFEPVFQP